MRKTIIGIGIVAALATLPFLVPAIYHQFTAFPKSIMIASGPQEGQYQQIAADLAKEIESQLGIEVKLEKETHGSLDNLRLLRQGDVDFALYQPGTERVLDPQHSDSSKFQPQFVANVYPEVTHWFVRRGSGIKTPGDLVGRKVALGEKTSGDYAMSKLLLKHFGLKESDVDAQYLSFVDVRKQFAAGELDAAFMTLGTHAETLTQLAEEETCDLLTIPYAEAFTRKLILPSPYTIPAGMYDSYPAAFPNDDVQTISIRASLLTNNGVDANLVEAVTSIFLSEKFLLANDLGDLVDGGKAVAMQKPEFEMHPGATAYYDPELKPLLPTDFVEATEGMRSFLVSSLIAVFLLFRWYASVVRRRKEHWLDQCIKSLLEIERRQVDLDQKSGTDDCTRLQKLLDEVTDLRQGALRKVSAHDLSEDRAADCFLEMCHALSDKINAKITRQRLERQFEELGGRLGK
ncbi:TAXI family TRAP transporter solute-binding subunit [Symmachiella dynata]|uniref:TAXI family TRAP transporter solute-binding subunit n=1 Tax=Symmachiella dynata TaxID=2527995 RepID=UPI0030ED4BA9